MLPDIASLGDTLFVIITPYVPTWSLLYSTYPVPSYPRLTLSLHDLKNFLYPILDKREDDIKSPNQVRVSKKTEETYVMRKIEKEM